MENERTLAYSMARELTAEELNQVSGGAKSSGNGTIEATYTPNQGTDASVDVSYNY